ncbi:MAG: helix-turn-helix transcriptional regulator [Myxococcota bacterium]
MVREARDLDDFLRSPRGACFLGRSVAFWNLGAVAGWRVWGAPQVEDGRQLTSCIDTLYAEGAPRYWSLVDLRSLESVAEPGFEVLRAWVERRRKVMARRLVRQAVVRPRGLVGAMVSGFYVQLEALHAVRLFDDVTSAARWLAPEDTAALKTLTRAFAQPPVTPGALDSLRAWLHQNCQRAELSMAARALGVSPRTLQRRLREAKTTFLAQLRVVRVELAQRLLRETDWKLAAIAQEVGFDSSQRLATSFRRHTQLTPSAFRAQARAALGR